MLPVNVMACRRMLILCGTTYATRLWCAWELFTLFSFQDSKRAGNSVSLVVLDYVGVRGLTTEASLQYKNAQEGLTKFNLNEAHTYDPNEEAKLRYVADVDMTRDRRLTRMFTVPVTDT